eukprot:SM000048S16535  [mRNA]  locus=s48:203096:208573:- [translate_table: standard]
MAAGATISPHEATEGMMSKALSADGCVPLPPELPLDSLRVAMGMEAGTFAASGNAADTMPAEAQQELLRSLSKSGSELLRSLSGRLGEYENGADDEGTSSDDADARSDGSSSAEDYGKLVTRAKSTSFNSRTMNARSLLITEPEADDDVTGVKELYMAGVLSRYRDTLVERTQHHLGYPYNLDFEYGALSELQHFSINNLGDPFIESNYGVHSREFEVGVLDWFAHLWELERGDYWGYITNCGTEGNLHGILVGREVLPDGILYASKESHYSVFKAARMYRMDVVKVETLLSGEIDCKDLREHLEVNKAKPAILNVNIGTTVKGAVDDLDLVIQTLKEVGYSEDRFYIHCDGALFGLMMPFVKKAPKVTFKKPIGSVSVSGHKFVGCPMPCGVQITRMRHITALSQTVEYLASRDATIMGSRNGHAPLFLWYTLNRKGYRGFQKEVQRCLRNAHYLHGRLRSAGFGAMLNELSSTVVFERPPDEEFVRKWQLACQGKIAHAVVMPSVSVEKLDTFVSELIESRAKCFPDGNIVAPCVAEAAGPGPRDPLDLEVPDALAAPVEPVDTEAPPPMEDLSGVDPLREVADAAREGHSDEAVARGAVIHDFCLGIPYGAMLVVGGLLGFLVAGSTSALRFGVLLGGAVLGASFWSLRTWRRGASSTAYIAVQAAITLVLVVREWSRFSQARSPSLMSRAVFPTGVTAIASAAMLAFYAYVILAGGNRPKKKRDAALA